MTQLQHYQRWWHPISKNLASKRPVVWTISKTLHHLDKAAYRASKGRFTVGSILTGLPMVMLTSKGAKSGQPRSVPLVGFPDGEKLMFVASNWGQQTNPSWYYNLRTYPEATIAIAGEEELVIVHEAAGSERERYWQQAVDTHAGYAAYEQRANGRMIPIMVAEPVTNAPSAVLGAQ